MKDLALLSDEQIIEIVIKKDKELYAEIINRYEKKLIRYANYLINNNHDALDIVQESFIKAYINLNSFNSKMKFSSWIYRIVHNQAINLISKKYKQQPLDEKVDINHHLIIDDEIVIKDLKLHAKYCLNQIPVKYKEPLTLYYLDEKSYEEISDIMRLPIGTVSTRINRAKLLMKKICQKLKK